MKKMNTIHLLPEFTKDMSYEERDARFMENWELAATVDFIPDSLETLRAIDYTELRMLMNQNEDFFNAAVNICADMIDDLIYVEKEVAREMYDEGEVDETYLKTIQEVVTLDDLLNCGHYCDDFESSKGEFINILVEDHLYKGPFDRNDKKTRKTTKQKNATENSLISFKEIINYFILLLLLIKK